MIEIKDIEKLSSLARISVTEEEKIKLQKDLESILNYVSELQDAPAAMEASDEAHVRNVMREDVDPYAPETFTEEILSEAPDRSGNYFKVKKIFN